MAEQVKLTAQQRAALFAIRTRKTEQTLSTKAVPQEMSTVQFELPKARLLSKIFVEVEATATVRATAGSSVARDAFSPYKVIRGISLDLNNGFKPFVVSGADLMLYNMNRLNPSVLFPNTSKRSMNYVENAASSAGVDNKIKFVMELPITLNERDLVGLILLQNQETQVTLTIDVDTVAKAYKLNSGNGETAVFKDMKITPLVETFTVPNEVEAMPDISVLKLVQSKTQTIAGGGQTILPLQTGQIYRKIAFYFEDNAGNPFTDADFTGNLEFLFNTADTPVQIKPSILAARNTSQLGYALPDGVYMFDLSYQGIPGLGGSRDHIDTERLTQFEVRFNTQKAGKLVTVAETLSRLR